MKADFSEKMCELYELKDKYANMVESCQIQE